jgi:tetratricopeptide (TPR) repeat protein
MREAIQSLRSSPSTPTPCTTLGPEVDARLDWRGGMNAYHRDRAWQRECIDHFAFNIQRAMALAREHGVPLLLMNPAANLDWPPFKAEHRDGLSEADLAKVDELWEEARTLYRDDRPQALGLLKQASAIDSQHAGLQFDLGKCYQSLGLLEQARAVLVRAKDLDICPLRILEPMHAILLDSARKADTMLVDADALFASHSPGGINGAEWFADHVHPTIEGHQLLADAVLAKLVDQRFVKPSASWDADKSRAYREHLDTLPANYYSEGMRRLTREQGWAHGRATKTRALNNLNAEDAEAAKKTQKGNEPQMNTDSHR